MISSHYYSFLMYICTCILYFLFNFLIIMLAVGTDYQKYLQKLGAFISTWKIIVAYSASVLDTSLLLIKCPHQLPISFIYISKKNCSVFLCLWILWFINVFMWEDLLIYKITQHTHIIFVESKKVSLMKYFNTELKDQYAHNYSTWFFCIY